MFTTSGVQRIYDVSPQTVRNWTIQFKQYLSMSATPKDGKRRQFTIDDLTVFSLVKEMTDKGFSYDEVAISLDKGQRGEVPETVTNEEIGGELLNLNPQEVARTLVLIKERDRALGRIEQLVVESEKKDAEISRLNEKINELNREIGKLEAKIEFNQEKKSQGK